MNRTQHVPLGTGRSVRIGPWRGRADTAHVVTFAEHQVLAADVDRVLAHATHAGFRTIVTGALNPAQAGVFIDAGFTVQRTLVLLEHDLVSLPPRPVGRGGGTRRPGRGEQARLLDVDAAAFDDFWRFDLQAFQDACHATPLSRVRVTRDRPAAAYAIGGAAARTGYVQRVAVEPAVQGQGHGRRLTIDLLHWMAGRRLDRALVNTQTDNTVALGLYRSLGFVDRTDPLVILGRSVDG